MCINGFIIKSWLGKSDPVMSENGFLVNAFLGSAIGLGSLLMLMSWEAAGHLS